MNVNASEWFAQESRTNWPSFRRGDVILSLHQSLVSRLIGALQGKKSDPHLSHVSLYVGGGKVAEATYPFGGVNPADRFFGKKYTTYLFRIPELTENERARLCSEAIRLAPAPYDKTNILRHLADTVLEAIGFGRPFAKSIRDRDGKASMVCSEMLEYAFWQALKIRFQDNQIGQAMPSHVWTWLVTPRAGADGKVHQWGRMMVHQADGKLISVAGVQL